MRENHGDVKRSTFAEMDHPRLPNGFGTIRYLGPGRRFAYAVHPPREPEQDCVTQTSASRRPAALCYVMDWFTGLAVLASWHAGFYQPGMECTLDERILRRGAGAFPSRPEKTKWTIEKVWEAYYQWKFGENAIRKLSAATEENYRMVSKKLQTIWNRTLDDLTIDDLQSVVNASGSNVTIVSKTRLLIRELYQFALPRGYCTKNPAQYVLLPDTEGATSHEPFTDEELKILWDHHEDSVVGMILIMSYSGYRIGAWREMKTNLEGQFFQGGIKTDNGKNRLVPIHSGIRDLIQVTLTVHDGYLCGYSESWFRRLMSRKLIELGIDNPQRHHSPHSCRHTFSRLCESYGVREADRKRMMGHSFGNDLTNGVYGHRTVEELRSEIEKIQIPSLSTPAG